MTLQEIATVLGLSLKTVKRYESTNNAPRVVVYCLTLIGGHIPTFSKRNDFTGWSFGDGFLWSPAGEKFTSGDVLSLRINLALIRSQRVELEQIKSRSIVRGSAKIIPFPSRLERRELKA